MISAYIHIPFCNNICSYCDFCKLYYNKIFVSDYLDALENEVNNNYKGEVVKTLYIGGGTPSSLDINELNRLFKIVSNFKLSSDAEFTIECNIEDIEKAKIELFKKNGVNRISIGIESFNKDILRKLNRTCDYLDTLNKINMIKDYGIDNINIDLMYAIEDEKVKDLERDLDLFLSLNVPHISTYSLIVEPNTKFYIENVKNVDEDIDYEMYKLICNKLSLNGYKHYEISNFSKDGYSSKHNLVYWDNLEYYGFGLGASGYIDGVRYTNTRNINKYIKGNYILESNKLSEKEKYQNEMILGLRKISGVNKEDFYKKYNKHIEDLFDIDNLIKRGLLIDDGHNIYINSDYIYLSNDILINFID